MTVAIALRMSTDRGDRIEQHLPPCQEMCARLGLGDAEAYVDNNVSASKDRGPKTRYYALMKAVRAGRVTVVVCFNIDRFLRRVRDLEEWLTLAEQGKVRLLSATEPLDTSTPDGRMYLRIKVSVAQHEAEHKAQRQRFANDRLAEAGEPPVGGRRAFGYSVDGRAVIEREAELIRSGAAELLAGASLRSIARTWNAAGVSTQYGRPWAAREVRDVLANPRAAGLRTHRGVVLEGVHGKWPTILVEDIWRGVRAILDDPDRRKGLGGGQRQYLLPGLARCGRCGAPMRTSATRDGVRGVRCSAAAHLQRRAEPIELRVREAVIERLSKPDAMETLIPPPLDLAPLHVEAKALRAQRIELAGLGVSLELAAARDRKITERLAEIDRELVAAAGSSVLAEFIGRDPRTVWEDMDLDRRRATVAALFEVVVMPVGKGARGFDPESVPMIPRPGV